MNKYMELDYILKKGFPYVEALMIQASLASCSISGIKITKSLVDSVCNDLISKCIKIKKITKNSYWTTADGKKIKYKDMEDTHIANILYSFPNNHSVNKVLLRIAKERGLTHGFLDKAPYPYKNKDGKWEIWDIRKGTRKILKNKPKNKK